MTKYVLANWKAHKTLAESMAWLEAFCAVYRPDPQVNVILAPPAVYLVPLWQKLQEYDVAHLSLAAQDLSPFPLGAYTGALAAEMLRNFVRFAILGHAERRRYFHETHQEVANKVREATAAKLTPILCVDQPYARAQLAALHEEALKDLIIGYGPVEAIGINIPQSPARAKAAIEELQTLAPDTPLLYGGSVTTDNAGDYLQIAGVAGVMAGSASLDPEEFARICNTVSAS